MSESYEGGCLCGQTRFRALGPATNLCFCHCRSCRLASGAPLFAWGTFEKTDFAYVRGSPTRNRSSAQVWREFCSGCGTALTYAHDRRPAAIDVSLTALDDPGALAPQFHIWTSERLAWVVLGDELPQYPGWRTPAS
jgi:hypothetical protein